MEINDLGFLGKAIDLLKKVKETQSENIDKATDLMVEAIERDQLIHVYGGGGHTTLVMGEMFFRAGGLANINPIMETGLSVFNQALKYLELERTVNYGSAIVKYYEIEKGNRLLFFIISGLTQLLLMLHLKPKKKVL